MPFRRSQVARFSSASVNSFRKYHKININKTCIAHYKMKLPFKRYAHITMLAAKDLLYRKNMLIKLRLLGQYKKNQLIFIEALFLNDGLNRYFSTRRPWVSQTLIVQT